MPSIAIQLEISTRQKQNVFLRDDDHKITLPQTSLFSHKRKQFLKYLVHHILHIYCYFKYCTDIMTQISIKMIVGDI